MSPLAAKKSLRLATRSAPTECWMMTDRRRVEQVLFNLISNAIKFSETGEIRIECEVDGDAVLTRVVDQGIGIKPEDMHNLFVPYKQIDSSLARRHQGTGLGLSISMKLVQAMGGHLHAHSEWGVGSTFGFTLPLVPDLRG
jgi:signal transduction histidine kinase